MSDKRLLPTGASGSIRRATGANRVLTALIWFLGIVTLATAFMPGWAAAPRRGPAMPQFHPAPMPMMPHFQRPNVMPTPHQNPVPRTNPERNHPTGLNNRPKAPQRVPQGGSRGTEKQPSVVRRFGEFHSVLKGKSEQVYEHHLFVRRVHRHSVHWARPGWFVLVPGNGNGAGTVLDVLTGDTLTVRNAIGEPQRVRLFATAAPLLAQPVGVESKQNLASLVLGKAVSMQTLVTDPDGGDPVAMVYCDDGYVNRQQLVAGMAWNYVGHGLSPDLADAESEAMAQGVGIWSLAYPEVPWQE